MGELDRLPGGFLSFGDDGIIQGANVPLAAMFDLGMGELVGRHVETLLTVPSKIFYHTHLLPLLKMQGHLNEVYVTGRTSQGEDLPLLLNAVRTDVEGQPRNECLVIAMRNRSQYEDEILRAKHLAERATEEKARVLEALSIAHQDLERQQAELRERNEELHLLKESLEDHVRERTDELDSTIRELQGLTYSMAHDLRAPLRAIVTTSAVLLEENGPWLGDEQRRLLSRQRANALKLSRLVDDLLKLSRLGLEPIAVQPVDLSKIACAVGRSLLEDRGRDNIQLRVQEGLIAKADPGMMEILLQNLLENAIKYSPQGGTICVGSEVREEMRVFYVRDQGIGIDSAYFAKIFRPFERLHRDEEFEGTGVGLASVERIVLRHGGHVWVESEPRRGTTFLFTLGTVQHLERSADPIS